MREISTPRLVLGFVLWAVLLGVVGNALLSPEGTARGPAEKVLRFASESPRRLRMTVPTGSEVRIGDPVLVPDPKEFLIQVGRVVNVIEDEGEVVAILRVHPDQNALLREGMTAEVFTVPSSAAWIITTLLPPARREEIREMIRVHLDDNGQAMSDALWPEVRRAILEVLAHVERELRFCPVCGKSVEQQLLDPGGNGVETSAPMG